MPHFRNFGAQLASYLVPYLVLHLTARGARDIRFSHSENETRISHLPTEDRRGGQVSE